ncbi:nuclear transport factor 2 family protein [Streptomyces sp. NPDC002676]
MSETLSPREVVEKLIEGTGAGRYTELADLYAEDGVMESAFEPVGPRRFEGRAAINERFAQAAGAPMELTPMNVVIRETDDAEVVVAEFDYKVYHRVTERTFEVSAIQVLRVRDGLIVHSRGYTDHLALIVAGGALPMLVKALENK